MIVSQSSQCHYERVVELAFFMMNIWDHKQVEWCVEIITHVDSNADEHSRVQHNTNAIIITLRRSRLPACCSTNTEWW